MKIFKYYKLETLFRIIIKHILSFSTIGKYGDINLIDIISFHVLYRIHFFTYLLSMLN